MSTHPAMIRTLLLMLAALLISPVQAARTPAPAPGRQFRLGGPGPTYTSDRPGTRAVAERWIVRLKTPALAQAPDAPPDFSAASVRSTANGRLLVDSPSAQRYRRQLQQQQAGVFATLQRSFPRAQMQRSYQILFNGLAVSLPGADAAAIDRLRGMREVAEVYPDQQYDLDLFASVRTIGADVLWQSAAIGGVSNAGAGVKIAVIDAGIKIDNPFFNPAGFSYPAGYPKGDTAHTTPKVITARAYFRPDLPPLEGEETPEPGPEASSHGTHVAGIAAGVANTQATVNGLTETISGVAPRAYLMNYKVFYENESIFSGSGFSIELMAALEDAVADGADVINNSWGGRAESDPRFDALAIAASAAVDAGVTVIYSAGNEGPDPSTAGSPGFAEKVISVGATTTSQTIVANFLDVTGPGDVPDELKENAFQPAAFGPPLTAPLNGPYVLVATVSGSSLACDPLPAGSLAGKIALIERGVCAFSIKVYNAQQGGALAAIVYNTEAGGDTLLTMAPDRFADEVTIPAVFVGRTTGTGMVAWYAQAGPAAQVQLDPRARAQELTPDVLTGFSSRGPTFQGTLKPDVVAPGFNILSSGFGEGEGVERHKGFGLVSGTSMAAPHVTGGAALLRQVHPNWSPLDIKSALMSTAATDVWLDLDASEPAGILEQGAGRIDLPRAAAAGLLFDRPSLSFGRLGQLVGQPTRAALSVSARNVSGKPATYTLAGTAADGSNVSIRVAPATLTLAAGQSATFVVEIELPADAAAGPATGMIAVTGPQQFHLPLLALALPAQRGPKVLLLDNDGSSSFEFPDYAAYYANVLEQLGVGYTHYDVDARAGEFQTLPELAELQQYEIVLWFTGDSYVPYGAATVPTPLTVSDQNILIAYLQGGGNLIATGQDLSWASDVDPAPDPRYNRSDLYQAYLGARFIQDDVYTRTTTLDRTTTGTGGQAWLDEIVLDLRNPSGPDAEFGARTSAGNQVTIDEVGLQDSDPRVPDDVTQPILQAVSTGRAESGYIGLNRSAEPSLEQSALAFPYRTTYLAFGLEGVRSDTGVTTRAELTQALLYWHVDRPSVSLSGPSSVASSTEVVTYQASATTNTPAFFVRYRWDFGDGTPIVTSFDPVVVHQFARAGSYNVRVEATDSYGHRALSSGLGGGAATPEPGPSNPTAGSLTFPETGQTLGGRFLEYWQQNGGLPVFGFPLAAQSGTPLAQVFERARFELHPANAAPYDVLLSRLGVEALAARGQDWHAYPTVAAAPAGCLYFAETQHSVCGSFMQYWRQHGLEFDGRAGSTYAESLALFGLPLSEPVQEQAEDGTAITVQWFERARFEYHPGNAAPYKVLLARLGADAFHSQGR